MWELLGCAVCSFMLGFGTALWWVRTYRTSGKNLVRLLDQNERLRDRVNFLEKDVTAAWQLAAEELRREAGHE